MVNISIVTFYEAMLIFGLDGDIEILKDKEYHDVHAIAGLLKMWLRELPENILTESLLIEFSQSIGKDINCVC